MKYNKTLVYNIQTISVLQLVDKKMVVVMVVGANLPCLFSKMNKLPLIFWIKKTQIEFIYGLKSSIKILF